MFQSLAERDEENSVVVDDDDEEFEPHYLNYGLYGTTTAYIDFRPYNP